MTTHHTHEAHAEGSRVSRIRPSGGPPPLPRSINKMTILGLTVSGIAVVLVLFSANDSLRDWLWIPELELMASIADNRTGWLTTLLDGFYDVVYVWAVPLLVWIPLAVLIITGRFRSAFTFFFGFLAAVLVVSILGDVILRPRPVGLDIIGRWEGFSHPDRKMAAVTAAATSFALHSVPHGSVRRWVKIVVAIAVGLFASSMVYLGVATPTSVIASVAIGFSIPQLSFRFLTPPELFPVMLRRGNMAHLEMTSERVNAIRSGIADQLGIGVKSAKPIGLDGSAGSTPLLLETSPDNEFPPELFAKLYAGSHLRSDRLYKLGRTILYGRLEDEASFTSVRQLVQYEDYLALKLGLANIRTPLSMGIVELTPEREYVAVFEFLAGSQELGDVIESDGLSVQIIEDGIEIVDQLWHAGLAHRDIKPSNLMVSPDGRLSVIDVAFAEVRPTRWRQSVDLGNMMMLLALGAPAQMVYDCALQRFTADEIADGLAAAHGVAVPTQLKTSLKAQREDVRVELRSLAPDRRRVRIQRWSFSRVLLAISLAAAVISSVGILLMSAHLAGLVP